MNNGPASVPCLVGVVPKRAQWKQKIPFGQCRESSSAPGVTCNTLRSELWARHRPCVSPYHYSPKVTQANGNNGDSGDRCIRKATSRLSVYTKGQKSLKVSEAVYEVVNLCTCTSLTLLQTCIHCE